MKSESTIRWFDSLKLRGFSSEEIAIAGDCGIATIFRAGPLKIDRFLRICWSFGLCPFSEFETYLNGVMDKTM